MKRLSPRQQLAAHALGMGASQRAVAREQGINRSTLARWMAKPEFQAAIEELRADVRRAALDQLTTHVLPRAVRKIADVLDQETPAASASAQLKAAELAMRGSGALAVAGSEARPQVAVQIVHFDVTEDQGITALAEVRRRRALDVPVRATGAPESDAG